MARTTKTPNWGAGVQRRYLNKKLGRMLPVRYPLLKMSKDAQAKIQSHLQQIVELAYNQGREDRNEELEKFTATEPKRTKRIGGLGRR
jgi:hypothetical protein